MKALIFIIFLLIAVILLLIAFIYKITENERCNKKKSCKRIKDKIDQIDKLIDNG